jgi:hypothetical protein
MHLKNFYALQICNLNYFYFTFFIKLIFNYILSQNKETTNSQSKLNRSSGNFIDELQSQFKNGGLSSVLRKKNTPISQNQNIDNIFNNVRGSSSANDIKKILKSNDENQNVKQNIEQDIKHLRESLLKKHEPQIPEWKRQLIEKRKQRENAKTIRQF